MKDDCLVVDHDLCVQERRRIFGATFALTVEYPGTRWGSRLCEYNLSFHDPVFYDHPYQQEKIKETRGYRERERSQGKFVPPITDGALRDELIIVAGAQMSASDVVHTLRNFADEVEKHGLWIGKYGDEYVVEKMDRTLTVG